MNDDMIHQKKVMNDNMMFFPYGILLFIELSIINLLRNKSKQVVFLCCTSYEVINTHWGVY